MRNNYYIFVIAHSIRGRIRRVHVPQYFVYICAVFALIGFVTVAGAVGSYTRMLLKVARYNHLRSEADSLKQKYQKLRTSMSETQVQLASLQMLASEVSVAYGITRGGHAARGWAPGPVESQTVAASLDQFQLLLTASYTPPTLRRQFLASNAGVYSLPMDWPVEGRLTGGFGDRLDPFRGEGTFHAGVDISTAYGTPVRVAADGVIVSAARESGYGRCVVVDHGSGVTSLYAHLSGFNVAPGQSVLGGEIIGFVGSSGRATGPHLHYEVRSHDAPVNPMRYLRHRLVAARLGGDD